MNDAQADRVRIGAEAIIAALSHSGIGDDPAVLLGALGAVAGWIAVSSKDPKAAMAAFNNIAEGVISGDLLEHSVN